MNKGKSANVGIDSPKKPPKRYSSLGEIFKDQQGLGWQIMDIESSLYSEMEVSLDSITVLTTLYMRVIEKLNTLQDPREQYFNLKMQKLMAEPYVIRCFNSNQDNKKSALESRRKDLEQKIEKEVERQNHRKVVQQVIIAQEEKETKMMNKVKEIVDQSHRNLQERIRKRSEMKEMRNSLNSSLIASSESSIGNYSPRFTSNRRNGDRDRFHDMVNSSFDMNICEEDEFRNMRREIEEEEMEERMERKLQRNGINNIISK